LIDTLSSATPEWILKLISSTQERDPTQRPTFDMILNQMPTSFEGNEHTRQKNISENVAKEYANLPNNSESSPIPSNYSNIVNNVTDPLANVVSHVYENVPNKK